jgi:hypothetical protein
MGPGSAFVALCLALKTRKKGNVDFQCLMFIFTRGKTAVNLSMGSGHGHNAREIS